MKTSIALLVAGDPWTWTTDGSLVEGFINFKDHVFPATSNVCAVMTNDPSVRNYYDQHRSLKQGSH